MAIALVLGAASAASAEESVPVPVAPVEAVDSGQLEEVTDPEQPNGAADDPASADPDVPAQPESNEVDDAGSEAIEPGSEVDAGGSGAAGRDPAAEGRQDGGLSDSERAAPAKTAAAAEKSKKVTSAAFAEKVHLAAAKRAGWSSFNSDNWGGDFKATKCQKWWARIDGKNFVLSNSPSQSTVTKYRKAVASQLKKAGLKQRGTASGSNQISRTYSSSRFTCTVQYTVPSQYGYSAGAGFSCTTTSKVKQAVKKTKPFAKAYLAEQKTSLKHISLRGPQVKKSASQKFKSYKKATVGGGAVQGNGTFFEYFAKAPKKGWRFVVSGLSQQDCRTFESNKTARRAWAGEACLREWGTPNGHQSTVRAK
ncbi:MAG: hypothetical protein ACK5LO_06135 [Leucobacter sp.]